MSKSDTPSLKKNIKICSIKLVTYAASTIEAMIIIFSMATAYEYFFSSKKLIEKEDFFSLGLLIPSMAVGISLISFNSKYFNKWLQDHDTSAQNDFSKNDVVKNNSAAEMIGENAQFEIDFVE